MSDPSPLTRAATHGLIDRLLGRLRVRRARDPEDREQWSSYTRALRFSEDPVVEEAEQALMLLAQAARGHS